MHRLLFLLLGLLAVGLTAFGFVEGENEYLFASAAQRPNIVFILTDDQRWDTLPYMPKLNELLVERGYRFDNAFVTTPLCCPSRASLLTGQYAHQHGLYTNSFPQGGARLFDHEQHIGRILSEEAGYTTSLIGKYMNEYDLLIDGVDFGGAGFPYVPPGWDDWFALVSRDQGDVSNTFYYNYTVNDNGTLVTYGDGPADYSTDVISNRAVDFIDASTEDPFFLYVNYWAPHYRPIAAPRHEGLFANLPDFRPPNYDEANVSDKPDYIKARPLIEDLPRFSDTVAQNTRRSQLETLLAVDDGVADIVSALDAQGKLDETIIIFASDNGWLWGEHRWWAKTVPYEESIRIPLVIRPAPSLPAGETITELVIAQDLTATILDLADVPLANVPFDNMVGRSLLDLTDGWRNDFLIEGWRDEENENETYIGVRAAQWKYIEYATGEEELYYLPADPYELLNLANDPDFESVRSGMANRLDALRPTPTPSPTATPSPED